MADKTFLIFSLSWIRTLVDWPTLFEGMYFFYVRSLHFVKNLVKKNVAENRVRAVLERARKMLADLLEFARR